MMFQTNIHSASGSSGARRPVSAQYLHHHEARQHGLHLVAQQRHRKAERLLRAQRPCRGAAQSCRASSGEASSSSGHLEGMDSNQLQTALNAALAAEDYKRASQIRDHLQRQGGSKVIMDWRAAGVPEWLAERAEQMGFRFPTDIQRRCAMALQGSHDAVIQSETGSGKTLAFLMPLLSQLNYPPAIYPEDLKGPQLVVLVPSMELGVQEAMLTYKLFGGSVNPGIPGASANMFAYSGPRNLKVRGILNEEEVELARSGVSYLKGVHVVIATPDCLAQVLQLPEFASIFLDLKAVAVDEVDACFLEHSGAMEKLLTAACAQPGRPKPVLALVGATVPESLAELAVQMGWMTDPIFVNSGEGIAPRVPRGLQHRYMIVDQQRKLAVLCRQIRADLEGQGQDAPPPRVIVFASNEEAAAAAADPLRTALWGQHTLSVLLPHGEEPIKAMHAFRDNTATFLLATPAAARGLDMPAVSHVYNLDCPQDATSYLHRAGRAGRIGSPVTGVITTLVTEEEKPALLRIAGKLGLELQEQGEPQAAVKDPEEDLDSAKRGLEDLFNLL